MKTVCAVVMLLGLAMLAAPSIAAADTLAISTSPDPTEDVTYQFTFSGSTGQGYVYATIKPTGGRPCGANPDADDGTELLDGDYHQGTFAQTENHTTSASGTYLVCGWLRQANTSTISAATQLVVNVRTPYASITPRPPVEVGAGGHFPLQIAVQTELGRAAYEAINAPGVPCGANWDANRSVAEVIDGDYTTGGPFIFTTNTQAPSTPGTYTVCAWVQEGSDDTVAEAVGSAPLVVFSQRCRKAQTDLGIFTARVNSLTGLLARPTSLRRGSRGSRVKKVQKRLHVKQTGRYFGATVRAVKRFQRHSHLRRTGIVDAKTASKMRLKLFDSAATRRTWKRDLGSAVKSQKGAQQAISTRCV